MYNPTDRFENWFITSLQTDVNDTATSFRLNKVLNVNQARLVIDPYDEDNREIVKVTSVDGNLVYVERGDDNTTPAYHNEGAIVALHVFAADLNELYADWAEMEVDLQTAANDANAAAAAANAILDDAADATTLANTAAGAASTATAATVAATNAANSATTAANSAATAASTAAADALIAEASAELAAQEAFDAADAALSAAGHFVPSGGLEGQVLTKASDTNYDLTWGEGGGGAGNSIVPKEVPTGLVNGVNTTYFTSQPYLAATLQVYIRGLAQSFMVNETNPATGEFTITPAPKTGDDLVVSYMFGAVGTMAADTLDGYHANATPTPNTIPVFNSSGIIPQEDWIPVTFENGWGNYSASWASASYMKDSMGFVHIQGLVSGGTDMTTVFTLPVGYRPAKHQMYTCNIYAAGADTLSIRVDVLNNGVITPDAPASNYLSLAGITFKAEQ